MLQRFIVELLDGSDSIQMHINQTVTRQQNRPSGNISAVPLSNTTNCAIAQCTQTIVHKSTHSVHTDYRRPSRHFRRLQDTQPGFSFFLIFNPGDLHYFG